MKNKLIAILLAVLLLTACAACTKTPAASAATDAPAATAEPTGAPTAEPTPEPVTLKVAALKGPTGMGLAYVMRDHQDAFNVEIFDAPDAVSAKFISGEIDIAAVPVNLAAVLSNKTGEAKMVAVNTLGVLYIVENGDSIQSLADLAGKTLYATGQGSTPEYVLSYLLEKNGLTDSVTVEYIGEHATLAAMAASGEAPLAMLPEPNVSTVLAKNETARVALDLTAEWNAVSDAPLVQGCYVVRSAVLEAHPEAVEAFIAACEESVAKVNAEEGAAALIAELGIVPSEAVAKRAIPRCNIVCLTGAEMQAAASGTLEILFNANPKSVGGKLPDASLYED